MKDLSYNKKKDSAEINTTTLKKINDLSDEDITFELRSLIKNNRATMLMTELASQVFGCLEREFLERVEKNSNEELFYTFELYKQSLINFLIKSPDNIDMKKALIEKNKLFSGKRELPDIRFVHSGQDSQIQKLIESIVISSKATDDLIKLEQKNIGIGNEQSIQDQVNEILDEEEEIDFD